MKTVSLIAAVVLGSVPASAQTAMFAKANCDNGILTIHFAQPIDWVRIDYARIMALCTKPA